MALIKIKNTDLYQAWLRYYENHCNDMRPFEKRTQAFLNSEQGINPPPCTCERHR